MTRHVAPHRFADALAGRLNPAEVAAIQRHVESCPSCLSARERIEHAVDAFADIREAEAPNLHWDHIGARIYWVTSSERRGSEAPARLWPVLIPGLAAAVIAVLWFVIGRADVDLPTDRAADNQLVAPGKPESNRVIDRQSHFFGRKILPILAPTS